MKRFKLNGSQSIKSLSKGMKIKYVLSLSLSHNADLLIMDELTSGLDPEARRELMTILKEYIQEEGKAVFFSTNITSDLEQVADEVIIINHGKILEQRNKDELLEESRLIKGSKEILENIKEKDFLLAKNYILIMILFSIGMSIFMFKEGPELVSSNSILYNRISF